VSFFFVLIYYANYTNQLYAIELFYWSHPKTGVLSFVRDSSQHRVGVVAGHIDLPNRLLDIIIHNTIIKWEKKYGMLYILCTWNLIFQVVCVRWFFSFNFAAFVILLNGLRVSFLPCWPWFCVQLLMVVAYHIIILIFCAYTNMCLCYSTRYEAVQVFLSSPHHHGS
jgi:hypothetical protein